jgi:hypothetical protein
VNEVLSSNKARLGFPLVDYCVLIHVSLMAGSSPPSTIELRNISTAPLRFSFSGMLP